ncbi:arsenical-resistance protein ACR3 [Meredithblackwellia eburnea MCA 4105]
MEHTLPQKTGEDDRTVAWLKETSSARNVNLTTPKSPGLKALGFLDKLLALWIILGMGLGIILGYFVPNTSEVLESVKFVDVSLPLALALILMMWPILCRVSPSALLRLFSDSKIWQQLLFSFIVNWILAPLFMLGLAWAFLPDKEELRHGLILVGIARCIAMVLVWTDIAHGDSDFCAVLVAFNSVLQIVLFAPMAILLVAKLSTGIPEDEIQVSYGTVAKSVAAFLGIPLAAALMTRASFYLMKKQELYKNKFLPAFAPLSLISLIFTTIIIFAAQGRQVVGSITSVLRVIAPLIVYFCVMFALVLCICRWKGVGYERSTVQAFTGASNNFELAIAVAVASYGANSQQALAATVGPLVEVPVLLTLAYLLEWYRKRTHWDIDTVSEADVSKMNSPSITV